METKVKGNVYRNSDGLYYVILTYLCKDGTYREVKECDLETQRIASYISSSGKTFYGARYYDYDDGSYVDEVDFEFDKTVAAAILPLTTYGGVVRFIDRCVKICHLPNVSTSFVLTYGDKSTEIPPTDTGFVSVGRILHELGAI